MTEGISYPIPPQPDELVLAFRLVERDPKKAARIFGEYAAKHRVRFRPIEERQTLEGDFCYTWVYQATLIGGPDGD